MFKQLLRSIKTNHILASEMSECTVSFDPDSLTRTGSTDRHASTHVFSMCFSPNDFKITCSRRSAERNVRIVGSEFNRTWRKPRRGKKTRGEWSIPFIFSRQSFDRALLSERLEQANLKGGILSRVKHLCLVNVLS